MAKRGTINKPSTSEQEERPIRVRKYKFLFLIICEDQKTEPSYFEKYKAQIPKESIFLKSVGTGKDPKGVVLKAIIERDKLAEEAKRELDEVWIVFDKDDAGLRTIFCDALFKMYPHITKEDILFWGTSKARVVFALPTINYSKNIPDITTSMGNYYIVNSAQIINGTLNVNETILVAENKLKEIINKNG